MTEVLFWVSSVPVILFPILYAVSAPWWRTPAGRQSMMLGLALLGLVALGLARRVFGADYPGKDVAVLGVYVLVAVALWGQVVLLVRVQILARLRKIRERTN